MIEDTVFIALNEGEADPSHRALYEPLPIDFLDGTPEPRRPMWQVGRV